MAPTFSKPQASPKDHSLTNLRTTLTVLTILHHTSIPYGGLGSWPYISPHYPSASSPTLVAFNATNQTFFMGTFFYLSGLLTFQSLQKKAPSEFLSGRWWRLGVPCAAYSLLAPPAQTLLVSVCRGRQLSGTQIQDTFIRHVKSPRSVRGPLWFNSLLLVFDSIHALFKPQFQKLDFHWDFQQAMTLDILANFLIRIPFPLGRDYTPLNLELGYLPQYIASYVLGARSSRTSTHSATESQREWLLAASVTSGLSLIGLLCLYPHDYKFEDIHGGMNLVAASYAVWNETTGYLIGTYLLDLFKRKEILRRQWGNVGRYQYAAFLVHPVLLVGIQAWFDDWKVSGVIKTFVIGGIGVLGSWGLGSLFTKLDILAIL
ncbi:uncharacterized protein LY89DRAFT_681425 [Mollisia scopiformis]|uniref:Acyltransferase 3 domain-containing protein n=1 Tax=Mollisia scopiformis TaxID=149040 RepID=A0A194XPC4_MOLSC|nr:uncharacterized protein LY89DRAFT_681425 [Mollisia scopiformis]KUJ22100.1 hypothetical protein LY89DRAFT_681425 [Mollisia scopiformis]